MTNNRGKSVFWFEEHLTPHETHAHQFKRALVEKKTSFQKATIADSYTFGRCLILDGEMQSAQSDEFIYHESLVHPALLTHPNPKSVLILGGGEGATSREILKHRTVERVVMVDIDREVVEFCQKYMEPWHRGSFTNRRHTVVIDDAKKFIEQSTEKFDIIISDLPSPMEAGPAYQLYTVEFYREMRKRLAPRGIFVTQAASGNSIQFELHQVLFSTLRKLFKTVRSYYSFVPSFDVPWGFIIASDGADPLKLTGKTVDQLLRRRVQGELRFYDATTHTGIFHVPKHLREALKKEHRVISKSRPIYFYK